MKILLIIYLLLATVACSKSKWCNIYVRGGQCNELPTAPPEGGSKCLEVSHDTYLKTPLTLCKDDNNILVLMFDNVVSNTCVDFECTEAYPLNRVEQYSPLCTVPEMFASYPPWGINGCLEESLWNTYFDYQFSQGVGNFANSSLEPFRYINDSKGTLKIQFFNTQADNKRLKPLKVDGIVDVIEEITVIYDITSPFLGQ